MYNFGQNCENIFKKRRRIIAKGVLFLQDNASANKLPFNKQNSRFGVRTST